jgi:hypothetical protein
MHVPAVAFTAPDGESGEAATTPAGIRSAARRKMTKNFDME